MHERFETDFRHFGANVTNVLDRVLASEYDSVDAEPLHHGGAAGIVHRELGGAVNLELRVDGLDQPNEPDILHDGRVDPAINAFTKMQNGVS